MTNQVNEVLETIREVCDLKRLEFGCEVKVQNKEFMKYAVLVTLIEDRRGFTWTPENGYPQMDFFGIAPSIVHFDEKHIQKIIGLPVHLEHLLWAVKGKVNVYITKEELYLFELPKGNDIKYNLQKSVEQNLNDNPDLTKWLHEVLVNKK